MAAYRFVTTWEIAAPRDEVFAVLHDSARWPEWWRGLESAVEVEEGDEEGRGSLGRYIWRAAIPYRVQFDVRITRVDRPAVMEGEAVGELSGTGRWELADAELNHGAWPRGSRGTTVTFTWDVRTTRRWMNALAPLLRPVFKWNHDWLMRNGEVGLQRRISAA